MSQSFWLTTNDNVAIHVKKWTEQDQYPQAIVQLSHGMVEHIDRYQAFAQYLVRNQLFVYGNDHRGHGKTGEKQGLLGYLAEKDGFDKTTEDLHLINRHIKQEFPNVPIFLFGHSMGSFLTRKYIQKYSREIDGVILSGTGYYPSIMTMFGKALASILPPKKKSMLMNTLAFGSNNKHIKGKKTAFDWLTNDENAVQAYLDDPLTGYVPTGRFFFDLMSGLENIHNIRHNQSIRSNLPMLLISGDADPVGNYGTGVWKTASLYQQIGLLDITVFLYEGARHELLHERNKEEVYQTIYQWIVHN